MSGAAVLGLGQPVVQRGQVGPRTGRARLDVQGVLVSLDRALVLPLPFGHDPQHDVRPGPVVVDQQAAFKLRQRLTQLRRDELKLFARDARLAPDAAFVQYRYGMLLYLHRRFKEAEQALQKNMAKR